MGKARLLAVAACLAGVGGVGATSALAGEITGKGKPLWTNTDQWGGEHALHGNSICAFSGQEDDQYGAVSATDDPLNVNPLYSATAGHSQSWGQGVRGTQPKGGFGGFNPGLFCNPTK